MVIMGAHVCVCVCASVGALHASREPCQSPVVGPLKKQLPMFRSQKPKEEPYLKRLLAPNGNTHQDQNVTAKTGSNGC